MERASSRSLNQNDYGAGGETLGVEHCAAAVCGVKFVFLPFTYQHPGRSLMARPGFIMRDVVFAGISEPTGDRVGSL